MQTSLNQAEPASGAIIQSALKRPGRTGLRRGVATALPCRSEPARDGGVSGTQDAGCAGPSKVVSQP